MTSLHLNSVVQDDEKLINTQEFESLTQSQQEVVKAFQQTRAAVKACTHKIETKLNGHDKTNWWVKVTKFFHMDIST